MVERKKKKAMRGMKGRGFTGGGGVAEGIWVRGHSLARRARNRVKEELILRYGTEDSLFLFIIPKLTFLPSYSWLLLP